MQAIACDPMVFESMALSNGITIYQKYIPLPYTTVYIILPVGEAHSANGIPPGTFHFLEHMCSTYSQAYPGTDEYDSLVGLTGGWAAARTFPYYTSYDVSLPNEYFDQLLPGMLARAFEPYITDSSIEIQRNIIRIERAQIARWFPGWSEMSNYVNTEWQWDCPVSLDHKMGAEATIENMSSQILENAHQAYFTSGIQVLVMGPGNIRPLVEYLENLPVHHHPLVDSWDPIRWVDREFREVRFDEMDFHTLMVGNFSHNRISKELTQGTRFILDYLTNIYHGPLYHWLRKEKGWIYKIEASLAISPTSVDWSISIPFLDRQKVQLVREMLWDAIGEYLERDDQITQEVNRKLGKLAYWYKDPDDIIDAARDQLTNFGRLYPLEEQRRILEGYSNPETVRDLFNQVFKPEESGSLCMSPMYPLAGD